MLEQLVGIRQLHQLAVVHDTKEANRGKGTHAPLLVGLAFILLAGVCLIFYYYGI